MKILLTSLCTLIMTASFATAQKSPDEVATGTIGGKTVTIKYAAPSVRGRKIFGEGGLVSGDPTYPVWRAGANNATALHTDGDLKIGGLAVPKGDYTLWVVVQDPDAWQLVINKQTGQWGTTYDPAQDLGRVKMTMSAPPIAVEQLKYLITGSKIELQWEKHIASVAVSAK